MNTGSGSTPSTSSVASTTSGRPKLAAMSELSERTSRYIDQVVEGLIDIYGTERRRWSSRTGAARAAQIRAVLDNEGLGDSSAQELLGLPLDAAGTPPPPSCARPFRSTSSTAEASPRRPPACTCTRTTVHYRVKKAEQIRGRPLAEGRLDVEVALLGVSLPAGAKLMLWFAAAGRDAAHHDHPGVYDITRRNARDQLTFGKGIRYCLEVTPPGLRLHPGGLGHVAQSSPQPVSLESVELEVLVERHRLLVDGIDHHGAGAELPATSDATAQGVDEQVTPELPALLGPVDGQTGEEHNRHGIGHAPP